MRKIFILLWVLCPLLLSGQTWDYPVKPGSGEWKMFETSEQMVSACQIPEKVLTNLPSKELAVICYNYPLFVDYLLVNDVDAYFSFLIRTFNGFKELFNRKDGIAEFIGLYADFKKEGDVLINKRKGITNDYPLLRIDFFEKMVSSAIIFDKLSQQQVQFLKEQSLALYKDKRDCMNNYGLSGLKSTLVLAHKASLINTTETKESRKMPSTDKMLASGSVESLDLLYNMLNQ